MLGPHPVHLPKAESFEAGMALLPRDALFGPVEVVPAAEAAGRISAEQITPHPPGIPALLPGEVFTADIVDYLRRVAAGIVIPGRGGHHGRGDPGRARGTTRGVNTTSFPATHSSNSSDAASVGNSVTRSRADP
jgi:hypothetical protein